MTTYYLYIDAGASIDAMSKFYKVAVSTSKQGRRDLEFLSFYAIAHGHYFKKYSCEVDDFLDKIAASLNPFDEHIGVLALPVMGICARALARSFRHGTKTATQGDFIRNRRYLLHQTSLSYRCASRVPMVSTFLPSEKKY